MFTCKIQKTQTKQNPPKICISFPSCLSYSIWNSGQIISRKLLVESLWYWVWQEKRSFPYFEIVMHPQIWAVSPFSFSNLVSFWTWLKTKGFKNTKSFEKKWKQTPSTNRYYNLYAFQKSYLMKDITLHSEMSLSFIQTSLVFKILYRALQALQDPESLKTPAEQQHCRPSCIPQTR